MKLRKEKKRIPGPGGQINRQHHGQNRDNDTIYQIPAHGNVCLAGQLKQIDKILQRRILHIDPVNQTALMFVPVAVQIPRYFVIVYFGLSDNFLANVLPLLAKQTARPLF